LDKLVIKGGRKLSGEVIVSGSKNAALPVFISTLLAPGANEIQNVPFLRDINTTIKVLESLGAAIEAGGMSCASIPQVSTTTRRPTTW
jgi:UDP-N-acetylglucosamine 1-carboxyvinyltransferase